MIRRSLDEAPCGRHGRNHSDKDGEEEDSLEDVTYLYKLAKGRCNGSFGLSVARKAGIPQAIIDRAREVAPKLGEKAIPKDK